MSCDDTWRWEIRHGVFALVLVGGKRIDMLRISRKDPAVDGLSAWASERWGLDLKNGASCWVSAGCASEIRERWLAENKQRQEGE